MNSLHCGDNLDILKKRTILLLFAILILPLQPAHSQTSPEEFFQKGAQLYEKQRYKEAAGEFTKAIEAKPDYAEAYYNLGITYWQLKEYQKAIKALEKVKELAPNSEVAKTAESDIKKLSLFVAEENKEQEKKQAEVKQEQVQVISNIIRTPGTKPPLKSEDTE